VFVTEVMIKRSSKGSTLSSFSGRAWNNVAKASLPQSVEWFSRDAEVMAKLPEKRSRQYIYDLLQKVKFNVGQLEAIVERRGGMVDFTCSCKEPAQLLVKLRSPLKEVGFVRLFDPEFTDIKVHWVPHRFPNSEMIKTIEERKFILQKHYRTKMAFTTVGESVSCVPQM